MELFATAVYVFNNWLTRCPKKSASYHRHVIRVEHGFIVMADRSPKNPCLVGSVCIDPNISMHRLRLFGE